MAAPFLRIVWLSDYVLNRLGGFIEQNQDTPTERTKPDYALIIEDGNIFNLMEITSRTLRENGMSEETTEMCNRILESNDYYKILNIIGEMLISPPLMITRTM